jgi:tRNA threonylcarbamoyladenosine biosynthesis protein TsaE
MSFASLFNNFVSKKDYILKDISQTEAFCCDFFNELCNVINKADLLNGGLVILLNGELGSGKTFISSKIIELFCKKGTLSQSPTFSIVNKYISQNNVLKKQIDINHYDLYRIKTPLELEEIGFYDSLFNSLTLIEWCDVSLDYLKRFVGVANLVVVFSLDICIDSFDKNQRVISLKKYEF